MIYCFFREFFHRYRLNFEQFCELSQIKFDNSRANKKIERKWQFINQIILVRKMKAQKLLTKNSRGFFFGICIILYDFHKLYKMLVFVFMARVSPKSI